MRTKRFDLNNAWTRISTSGPTVLDNTVKLYTDDPDNIQIAVREVQPAPSSTDFFAMLSPAIWVTAKTTSIWARMKPGAAQATGYVVALAPTEVLA